MKNNKGFGRFEVLTIIVLMLGLFAYLGYMVLCGSKEHKLSTMTDNAITFSKAVTVNNESFHNTEFVYLGEVIDEQLIKKIKNPVGSGYCSESESFVELIDGMPYVTLRCGEYLIEKTNFSESKDNVDFYKVSDWSEKKEEGATEEKVFYNCEDSGKEIFDQYYDELYFVYLVNKEFNSQNYVAAGIKDECDVVTKTFYRTKELVK